MQTMPAGTRPYTMPRRRDNEQGTGSLFGVLPEHLSGNFQGNAVLTFHRGAIRQLPIPVRSSDDSTSTYAFHPASKGLCCRAVGADGLCQVAVESRRRDRRLSPSTTGEFQIPLA